MPKKSAATAPKFPLAITKHQREALVHATRLRPKIKSRLSAIKGTNLVEFTLHELEQMLDEVGTATGFAPDPYRKQLVTVQRKVVLLLDAVREKEAASIFRNRRPKANADLLFQFRIALLDIKPAIWRRIQVRDCTLAGLHEYIQAAFGWWNCHLHQFVIDGIRFGPRLPDDFDAPETVDEAQVLLSKLFQSGKRTRFIYEYDFGDDWLHEVLFEGCPSLDPKVKYPLCLEGERACPPEDVGGPGGYAEFLDVLADAKHKRHDELLAWSGPFDSVAFDPKKATRDMRKAK